MEIRSSSRVVALTLEIIKKKDGSFSFVSCWLGQYSFRMTRRLFSKYQHPRNRMKGRQMVEKPILFREQMALARPDVVERQMRNRRKSKIALQLRVLRDGKGMTQADVAKATGMAIRHIERMESLIGPIPDIKDLECYVDACGGDIKTVMLTGETDQPNDNSDSSSPE
jgi:hypothetical protein